MIEVLRKGTTLYYRNKRTKSIGTVVVLSVCRDHFSIEFNGQRHDLDFDAINTRLFFNRALIQVDYKSAVTDQPKPSAKQPGTAKKSDIPQDLLLVCAECGRRFVWTVGEQEFYKQKGYSHPRTCSAECREKRKRSRENALRHKEFASLMQPSGPYRTGSAGKTAVSVSGGDPKEISAWTMENIEKGYTHKF